MKIGIMQPYFMPYIGYYQLIAAVDLFVIYDNIKYTKKGWINRNRLLVNGAEASFSLPLRKGSDSLQIIDREISYSFESRKLLNQFKGAYGQAPYFSDTFSLIKRVVCHEDRNLFRYLHHSLVETCCHLKITTPILAASSIPIDHTLKAQNKVLALCKALGAKTYINPIGGTSLYDTETFCQNGIELQFIQSKPFEYKQFGASFVPWLSIIDALMFVSIDELRTSIDLNREII